MNVYVRELATAIARAGVDCDVYTRAWRRALPPVVALARVRRNADGEWALSWE